MIVGSSAQHWLRTTFGKEVDIEMLVRGYFRHRWLYRMPRSRVVRHHLLHAIQIMM
jgi:hypothetical protein